MSEKSKTPSTPESSEPETGSVPTLQLARPGDVLPGKLYIFPTPSRPYFPGQVMPLIVPAKEWEETIVAVQEAKHGILGLTYVTTDNPAQVRSTDFKRMGTACRIHQIERHEDRIHIVLIGLQRFSIEKWVSTDRPYSAEVSYHPETHYEDTTELKAYTTAIINVIKELLPLNPLYGEELKLFLNNFGPSDPSRLADFGASLTTAEAEELQDVLETLHIRPRLEKALTLLQKELEIAKAQMEIRQHVETEMQNRQRDVFLREQLKFIQKELGISKDDKTAEVERFKQRIESLTLPEQAQTRVDDELNKLSVLEQGSPEYTVTRNYLDWLTLLPWGIHTEDSLDIETGREILDRDHEGLTDVKQRIVEFIGVGKMRGSVGGSVLLLVGPPGVGKTSLGQSIANALGRKFYRFSVGGMRDEAEIKGHRRTYIGAMPGKFIQALKESASANPVIMLDEIDKIGASYQGDPAAALLEVLDPEQNKEFLDHYLDVRFDLSNVLFVCTANQLDTIPGAMLDRMEVIKLSGYLASEKLEIASRHLVPKQLQRAGLKRRGQVSIDKSALKKIIDGYAREAGVRRLEKYIAALIRKAVIKLLEETSKEKVRIRPADIEELLGPPLFRQDKLLSGIGVVTGLAWTPLGGATLEVEATVSHRYNRGLKMTGQLGDVMRESAEIAYSYILGYVSENGKKTGVGSRFFDDAFIHLHVPAGATPKDGPSAGITMASALLSLASGKKPKAKVAMTGELTLTGQVMPVGGIQEKLIGARRAGFKTIILPAANQRDVEQIPGNIKNSLKIHLVETFDEVCDLIFDRRKG